MRPFSKCFALGDDNAKRGYQQIIDTYRQAKQWQKATDAAKEATQKLPKDRDLKMVYAGQLADSGPDRSRVADGEIVFERGCPKTARFTSTWRPCTAA